MSKQRKSIFITLIIMLTSTTACSKLETNITAETIEISQPIFAVSMSNTLTALVAQQRLSPLQASRIYGYMFAAALEAYNKSTPGNEVYDAVSAASVIGEYIFHNQEIPNREINTLVKRYSPEGRTEAGNKIGKYYIEIASNDGYMESAQARQPEGTGELWSWEPTGISRVPFTDPGYGDVEPLLEDTKECVLEEPDRNTMESEVREIFNNFVPAQTAEPEVLVFLSGIATSTPPGLMLQIASTHANDAKIDQKSALTLIALVAISDMDAGIATWREKRKFMIARPETVYMRLTGELIKLPRETPPHPSYPSGHSSFTGAATTVMDNIIGIDTPLRFFVNEDLAAPSEEWVFNNTSELREMVNWSRVRAAFHTRTDVLAGEKLGACIGEKVYNHYKEKGWI